MHDHEPFYARAFALAQQARGICSPNPNVGAVLVKNGHVIGEGHTQPCGQDHAEVQALKHATEDPRGAELYVTLEPCCHYGKTPPCTEAIISAGIRRVHAGIIDPNPKVNGGGITALQAAGIEVETGFLREKIERQLEAYLTWIVKKRPFVVLKTAASLDGQIAARDGSSRWITGEASRQDVHRLRGEADVVLTGIGTVLKDDPLLNCRQECAPRQPVRVVLDRDLRLPPTSRLASTAHEFPTLVFHACADLERANSLQACGIELVSVTAEENGVSLDEVFTELYHRNLQTVMVEAGGHLAGSMLRERRIDKWVAYMGALVLGEGISLFPELKIERMEDALHWKIDDVIRIGDDFRVTSYARYEKLTIRSATAGLFKLASLLPSRP